MWPPSATCSRIFQWPKFGNDTMPWRPMRSMCSSTTRGWRVACSVCDRMTKSKTSSDIRRDRCRRRPAPRKALGHALVDVRATVRGRGRRPAGLDQVSSSAPSPQPTSSTRAPRSTMSATASKSTREPPGPRAASAMVRS